MCRISEPQFEAFRDELKKEASKWYANAAHAAANFGKRQAHSMTGWTPKGFMNPEGIKDMGFQATKEVQDIGGTSIPGLVRSAMDPSKRGKIIPAAVGQLKRAPFLDKALMVGLPAADLAGDVVSKEPDPEHPVKGKKIGRDIAMTAAGLATGGLSSVGGMVAGGLAGAAGGTAGAGVDKLRGAIRRRRGPPPDMHVQPMPPPEESRGQSGPPIERNMSPSASGQAPDWGGA